MESRHSSKKRSFRGNFAAIGRRRDGRDIRRVNRLAAILVRAPYAPAPRGPAAPPRRSPRRRRRSRIREDRGRGREPDSGHDGRKSVGMYQAISQSPVLRDMVKTVIEVYGFTEVEPGKSKVTGGPSVRSRTKVAAVSTCRIDVADVLLQLDALQVVNDRDTLADYSPRFRSAATSCTRRRSA